MSLSPNAQAILLLTAPLIAGRAEASTDLLTPGEYKRLARLLRDQQRQPADLLDPEATARLGELKPPLDRDRLTRLLARGFLLTQALERWRTRAIWVVSRADAGYPRRLKARLKDDAPPVVYGCGDAAILDAGGLAVVGSRNVDEALVEYTEGIGRLAAAARRTLVSGGARGIDQAAMRGALEAGGQAAGVMADSLERAALNRDHRRLLMDGQLVLISPYDPAAGFNVGNAMQRNKLIYALADAALVVSSDFNKGGTWAGAVEQLDKLRLIPIYVRSNGETGPGLSALRIKGALPWPNPETAEDLATALAVEAGLKPAAPEQDDLFSSVPENLKPSPEIPPSPAPDGPAPAPPSSGSTLAPEDAFARAREALAKMATAKTEAEVAEELGVSKPQARKWLKRLVEEGVLEKLSKPVRYRSALSLGPLFDRRLES